jgi:hypothetical protein
LREAKRHFHLEANSSFRTIDDELAAGVSRKDLQSKFGRAWQRALRYEGDGEWEKILKWSYRLAARIGDASLRRRAVADVLVHPRLAVRIADYMRASGSSSAFLEFAQILWNHDEQVYPDVNIALFESFLRLEPRPSTQKRMRAVAAEILQGRTKLAPLLGTAAIAPLAILRFGDRRSLPLLAKTFTAKPDELPMETVRSAAVVYASYGTTEFAFVKRSAAKILRHSLTDLVRFVDRILGYREVPPRFKPRFSVRFDAVTGRSYFDMRSVVSLRLLALSRAPSVKHWVQAKKSELLKSRISQFDKRMIERLIP